MKKAWLEEDGIQVQFGGSDFKPCLELVKSISGRVFNPSTKIWTVPNNQENVDFLNSAGFNLSADIAQYVVEDIDESWMDIVLDYPVMKDNVNLYPFQKDVLRYIKYHGDRGVFGLPPGSGKTIMGLSFIKMTDNSLPALVICPSPVKINFKRDYEKFFGHSDDVEIIEGMDSIGKYKRKKIYVVNYELLSRSVEKREVAYTDKYGRKQKRSVKIISRQLQQFIDTGFRTVIADEIHRIKNEDTSISFAFKHIIQDAPYVIGMSGTPILKKPFELWNYWNMIKPGVWKKQAFFHRYCEPRQVPIGRGRYKVLYDGATNLLELHMKLRNNGMIFMKKEEILKDLPDKPIRTVVPIQLDKYDDYVAEKNFVLEQISEDRRLALTLFEKLKQASVKHKLAQVYEYIAELLSNEEKVVVFAEHQKVVAALSKKFKNSVIFNGSITAAQKLKNKERFINDPDCTVIIGNTQSMGTGVDGLQKSGACTIVFIEFPWNPSDLDQAEARLWRDGFQGQKGITAHYLVGQGTIEEEIIERLDSRKRVTEAVISGTDVEEDDLLTVLRDKYLNEAQALKRKKKDNNGEIPKNNS